VKFTQRLFREAIHDDLRIGDDLVIVLLLLALSAAARSTWATSGKLSKNGNNSFAAYLFMENSG
jgi:hypothetical protein